MRRDASQHDDEPEVLSKKTIRWGSILVVTVTAVAVTVLLWSFGGGGAAARTNLDIIRTAGSIGVGTGGGIALLLTARRQRSTERAAEHTRHDATERRITELQSTAGEQLGSENAIVRLNGLYSLERLADNHEEFRQVIVNLICAYLRMPFTPPRDQYQHTAFEYADNQQASKYKRFSLKPAQNFPPENRQTIDPEQELQVRHTAQRILINHLRPDFDTDGRPTNKSFWRDIDLDLRSALLTAFDFSGCQVRSAMFNNATFVGYTAFSDAHFSEGAYFTEATFHTAALFSGAAFGDVAYFSGSKVSSISLFDNIEFHGPAKFDRAQMASAWFKGSCFHQEVTFKGATLGRSYLDPKVSNKTSRGVAIFDSCEFHDSARFDNAKFNGVASTFSNVAISLNPDGSDNNSFWPFGMYVKESKTPASKNSPEGSEIVWGTLAYDVEIPEFLRGGSEAAARYFCGDHTAPLFSRDPQSSQN